MDGNTDDPLPPPHWFDLCAAEGWLGLGNTSEARAELAKLPDELQRHPQVLRVRWIIAAEEKNWADCLETANRFLEVCPASSLGWLNRAYALRRVAGGSVEKAFQALRPAFDKFPGEPTIPYNLACYSCQMDRLDEARSWFLRAIEIGGRESVKKLALADSDLECLWPEIRKI